MRIVTGFLMSKNELDARKFVKFSLPIPTCILVLSLMTVVVSGHAAVGTGCIVLLVGLVSIYYDLNRIVAGLVCNS